MRFRLKTNPLFLAGSLLADVLSFAILLRCLYAYNAALFGLGVVCFALGSFVLMPMWTASFAETTKNALRIRKGIFVRINIPYAAISAVQPGGGGLFVTHGNNRVFLRVEEEVGFLRALRDKLAQL